MYTYINTYVFTASHDRYLMSEKCLKAPPPPDWILSIAKQADV